jgi:hypothetical protein
MSGKPGNPFPLPLLPTPLWRRLYYITIHYVRIMDQIVRLEVERDEPRLRPGETGPLDAGQLHQWNLGSSRSARCAAIARDDVAAGEGAFRRKMVSPRSLITKSSTRAPS